MVSNFRLTDAKYSGPDINEVKTMIFRQLELMLKYNSEESAVRQMRKHVGFYVNGFYNAAQLRHDINICDTLDKFRETLTLWNA